MNSINNLSGAAFNKLQQAELLTDKAMTDICAEENDHSDVRGIVRRLIAAGYRLEEAKKPVLVGTYCGMTYGGHEVQMKHPNAKLELINNTFYCYE